MDIFEIVTTYSPVLTARELLTGGLVLAAISAMMAFLLLVAGVTLLSRPPWERSYELMPFWSYGAIARGMPGMLLPFIFGRPLRWHRGLLFGVVCSGCIEIAQLANCRGLCETDDVIHNSIGCMVGCVVGSWVIGRLQGRKTGDNKREIA